MARESVEQKRVRAQKIIRILKRRYPEAKCSLSFSTPHELLVATILSAQCTDERVNQITPALFRKYRTVQAFAAAKQETLEQDIRQAGFFRNKAKAIIASAQELLAKHDGDMPRTLEQMTALPGVGRKTGSVVLGAGFGLAEGIVVDTHVLRVSKRLGLTSNVQPEKVERELVKVIPRSHWIQFSHLLIFHGRAICTARAPKCPECPILTYCPTGQKLMA